MKIFSLIALFAATITTVPAFAAPATIPVTIIAFGIDGATGQSSPSEISGKNAYAIYKVLEAKTTSTGTKVLEGKDWGLESKEDNFSIAVPGTHNLKKVVKGKVTTILMPLERGDVSFEGESARVLFHALRGPDNAVKHHANISCGKVSTIFRCYVRDAQFLTLDVPAVR